MESNLFFLERNKCPVCESGEVNVIFSETYLEPPIKNYIENFYSQQGGIEYKYLDNIKYILEECTMCGLVYQRMVPNDFLMEKLYEEWIDPKIVFQSRNASKNIKYFKKLAREIELIINYFGVPPCELELLDFGMGWGEWCRMANAYGCIASGVEISKQRIEYAEKTGVSVLQWEDIPKHKYNFINSEQVFEHIADPCQTLKYLCKSLRPHGLIKISVPNGWDIKRRLSIGDWSAPKGSKNSLNPVAPLEHINCFSHSALLKMAQINGLKLIQVEKADNVSKSIWNVTLRDLINILGNKFAGGKEPQKFQSTYLFFQKNDDNE